MVELNDLLARADVVSMNLTLGTEPAVSSMPTAIARMKKGVIFSTPRARAGRRAALLAALASGHIRHAGLDVFHASAEGRSSADQNAERPR